MVYLYTSFLNQINVYDYPTRFLFQNVTSFSDFLLAIRYYEKRNEGRERERQVRQTGEKEKRKFVPRSRIHSASFLSFSKKGERRRGEGGVDEARIFIHSFFSHGPRPLDSSTQTCANPSDQRRGEATSSRIAGCS